MSKSLGCAPKIMKCILFIFNLFLFIVGVVTFALGIWILADKRLNDYADVINDASNNPYLKNAAVVLIIAGIIIFFVGFLGCVGAWKESACMLLMYAVLLILIFIIQFIGAILAVAFQGKLGDKVQKGMKTQVNEHVRGPTYKDDATTKTWNSIQHELKCCGANGPKDYKNSLFMNDTKKAVPKTCCILKNDDYTDPVPMDYDKCNTDAKKMPTPTTSDYLYLNGCYFEIKDWMKRHAGHLVGVGFGLAFLQIVGIVFACCLRRDINDKDGDI